MSKDFSSEKQTHVYHIFQGFLMKKQVFGAAHPHMALKYMGTPAQSSGFESCVIYSIVSIVYYIVVHLIKFYNQSICW